MHRVAVRLLQAPDGEVLATAWLRHGASAEDTIALILTRLGVDSAKAARASGRQQLLAVTSQPRQAKLVPVLVNVLNIDYLVEPGLIPEGAVSPEADECANEQILAQILTEWTDGSRDLQFGTDSEDDILRVQRPGSYSVLQHNGMVLLTRLSRTGRWTLPGGGIDHGEQPDTSLVREVYEEAGLELSDVSLVSVTTARWTGRAPDALVEDFQSVQFLYTGQVNPDVAPQVVEVDGSTDAVEWVGLDQAQERSLTYVAQAGLAILGIAPELS